jgi:integral membrane protein
VNVLPTIYRVLAYVVGSLLVFCSLMSLLKRVAPDGSGAQQLGEDLLFVWAFHGFIYLVYVVVAFVLATREGWTMSFTVLMLAAGLVPFLMFWVERVVAGKLRDDQAEPAPA